MTDLRERIRGALKVSAAEPRAADMMATEAAIFYYALASWRRKPFVPEGARGFSYHRRSGMAGLLYAVAALAVVEMTAVDLVVRVHHHIAANVLLAISAVGAVWLLGFARAVQLRPIVVHRDTVLVRLGLQWCTEFAISNIASAEFGRVKAPARRAPGYLGVGTQPNALLALREPVVANGLYGRTKVVRQIGLALDAPKEFEAAISGA